MPWQPAIGYAGGVTGRNNLIWLVFLICLGALLMMKQASSPGQFSSPTPVPAPKKFFLVLTLAPEAALVPGFVLMVTEESDGGASVKTCWAKLSQEEDVHRGHLTAAQLQQLRTQLDGVGFWSLGDLDSQEKGGLWTDVQAGDPQHKPRRNRWYGLDDEHTKVAALLLANPVFGGWLQEGQLKASRHQSSASKQQEGL